MTLTTLDWNQTVGTYEEVNMLPTLLIVASGAAIGILGVSALLRWTFRSVRRDIQTMEGEHLRGDARGRH